MRLSTKLLLLSLVATPAVATAQSAAPASMERNNQWRATVTIFRSPGTGLQVSKGHVAVFAAHYPTVIFRNGEQRGTQFVRVGAAYYVAPDARTSPYASLSVAPSLTGGWTTSGLADVGVRRMFSTRYSGQLGVAVLYAPELKETRVNPTIGFGVRF